MPPIIRSALAILALAATTRAGDDPDLFESRIRPIFAERCEKCHGEAKQKGKVQATRILQGLIDRLKEKKEDFGGGPVGIDTIAASLSESRDAIEDIVEPYLLQIGFLNRTSRGRLLTPHAFTHLGLAVPQRADIAQGVLPLGEDDD